MTRAPTDKPVTQHYVVNVYRPPSKRRTRRDPSPIPSFYEDLASRIV